MKPGPRPGANREPQSVDNMRAAWGSDAPDWVIMLATECDKPGNSQSQVARKLGISGSIISGVIRKTYKGNFKGVEDAVRGVFMNATLACTELGRMSTHTCIDWQKKSKTFVNVNPERVRMYGACRKCPHNRTGGTNVEH